MKECLCGRHLVPRNVSFRHPFDLACALEKETEEPVLTTPPAQFAGNKHEHFQIITEDNVCAAKELLQCFCIVDSFLALVEDTNSLL